MSSEKYTIKKSTIQSYKLRHPSGMYWADINIDEGEKSGRIQIASDFGSWQNFWGACGSSFKKFLTGISMDYFATKVGADRWFDLDATIRGFRHSVDEARKNKIIDRDEHNILHEQITEVENTSGRDEFNIIMWQQADLMSFFDMNRDVITDVTPGFRRFWAEVWPVFVAELEKELSE